MLVESKECALMWRGCVDVVAICNLTQLKIDIDVFNPETGAVEERQSYEPDSDFPWQVDDANKPNQLFSEQKIKTMKLINYKNSHFNLIIDKEHPLYPKTDVNKVINREKCKHCKVTFTEQHKMRDHMKKLHGDNLEKKTKSLQTRRP